VPMRSLKTTHKACMRAPSEQVCDIEEDGTLPKVMSQPSCRPSALQLPLAAAAMGHGQMRGQHGGKQAVVRNPCGRIASRAKQWSRL
jgi:hypothetical protein